MRDKSYYIRRSDTSDLSIIVKLGTHCFSDEWSLQEVAEILYAGKSLLTISDGIEVGFLLGMSFYIPQIPLITSNNRHLWERIENVGRIAYVYLQEEWRGQGPMNDMLRYFENDHHLAGGKFICGTIKKTPTKYKSSLNYFRSKGYKLFDNFGYDMHPNYDYVIKELI